MRNFKQMLNDTSGVLGFQTVADAAIEFFILALIVVAIIIGAYVLGTSSVLPQYTSTVINSTLTLNTTQSLAYNNTQSVLANVSAGPAIFFGYSVTIFQLL